MTLHIINSGLRKLVAHRYTLSEADALFAR